MKSYTTKLLFLGLFLIPDLTFGQFEMTPKSISGTVVYEADSMSAEKIYNKVLAYIQASYKNPEVVQKAQIPNEMVRIEGIMESPAFIKFQQSKKSFGASREFLELYYTLLIEMKDNKMRITCEAMQYSNNTSLGPIKYGFDFVFNKDGSVKEKRAKYKTETLEAFTALADHIYNYVVKKDPNW